MCLVECTFWKTLNAQQINFDFSTVKWKALKIFMEKCNIRTLLQEKNKQYELIEGRKTNWKTISIIQIKEKC